ncbi:unnamed protein product [Lota lota]
MHAVPRSPLYIGTSPGGRGGKMHSSPASAVRYRSAVADLAAGGRAGAKGAHRSSARLLLDRLKAPQWRTWRDEHLNGRDERLRESHCGSYKPNSEAVSDCQT